MQTSQIRNILVPRLFKTSVKMSLRLDYPLFIGLVLFVVVILSTVFYLGWSSDDLLDNVLE